MSPWYYLGYILPHADTELDAYQFYRVAPEGMVLVTTQLSLKEYSLAAVEHELGGIWERFDRLAEKRVDRVAVSGVPLAALLGRDRVLALLAQAEARTGLPCDTDLEAHVAALHHLGARRIVLATRWPEHVNQAVERYLAEAGVEVLACRTLGRSLQENRAASAAKDHRRALELGQDLLIEAPDAQAMLMPGGPWFALYAALALEAQSNKPVLLNITSSTWAALRAVDGPLPRYPEGRWGKLLASLDPACQPWSGLPSSADAVARRQ
jgi:maleate cis-trans isomerase